MTKIAGISFYEERLLFLLMRLRNPRARLIYVTSQPVHPMVLEYYLQMLVGIPASHARARLTLLCAYDSSPRSLTAKILERPRLMARIASAMSDPSQAYLTVFNATPLELSEDAPVACDVHYRSYQTCKGWNDFSNEELSDFCHELTGVRPKVIGKTTLPNI